MRYEFTSSAAAIPSLSLRSGNGVVTVLQGYCKGIAGVLHKQGISKG
jgi:hypothetical protein